MPINFHCECGKPFWTADANAGRRMICTRCGREIDIPEPREEGVTIIEPGRTIWSYFPTLNVKALVIRGIILGCLGMCFFLMLPAYDAAREAAKRSQCVNNLKQIGLAFHNYHAVCDRFPPQAITDARGKPLLSWRVAILPFIEEQELYDQFKLDEPWDSPANWPLIAKMPNIYRCPNNKRPYDDKTEYQVIIGPGSLYDGDKPAAIADVRDGTSNTICVAETKNVAAWTKPDDIDIRWIHSDLGSEHSGGCNVLFADGSVKFLKKTVAPTILQALATKAGGERVDDQY